MIALDRGDTLAQTTRDCPDLSCLSAWEVKLLKMVVAGYSQRAIAIALGLKRTEAMQARRALFVKVNARRAADAVRYGIEAGL